MSLLRRITRISSASFVDSCERAARICGADFPYLDLRAADDRFADLFLGDVLQRCDTSDHSALRAHLAALARRKDTDGICAWLEDASTCQLDRVVRDADWSALLRVLPQPQRILELLANERCAELSVESRAHLGAACVRERVRGDAECVAKLLTSAHAEQLTTLKILIDRESHGKLFDFVYLTASKTQRAVILAHFRANATSPGPMKIVSDLDNTYAPSRDRKRFPHCRAAYPGAPTLYGAIVGGQGSLSEHLVFLSARPGNPVFRWKPLSRRVAAATYKMLAALGSESKVLFGDIWHCVPRPWKQPLALLGRKKAQNFASLYNLYPECQFVFFGDTGEADIRAAVTMRKCAAHALRGVFIHDLGNLSAPARQQCEALGIEFYRTSAGAALLAYRHGLIDETALQAVAKAAQQDFDAIDFDSSAQRQPRAEDLKNDIAAIHAALAA